MLTQVLFVWYECSWSEVGVHHRGHELVCPDLDFSSTEEPAFTMHLLICLLWEEETTDHSLIHLDILGQNIGKVESSMLFFSIQVRN